MTHFPIYGRDARISYLLSDGCIVNGQLFSIITVSDTPSDTLLWNDAHDASAANEIFRSGCLHMICITANWFKVTIGSNWRQPPAVTMPRSSHPINQLLMWWQGSWRVLYSNAWTLIVAAMMMMMGALVWKWAECSINIDSFKWTVLNLGACSYSEFCGRAPHLLSNAINLVICTHWWCVSL